MKCDVITIPELAIRWRISRASAYRAARRGEIPTITIGRRKVVPLPALNRMLETGEQPHRSCDGEPAA